MKLLRGLHPIPAFQAGTVVTIGNFDGVHLGHQALLDELTTRALDYKYASVVLIFEPQPNEFFNPSKAPARLTTLREKLETLKTTKIDYVCCLKFNKTLAMMQPHDFAMRYFFSDLNAKFVLVGEDFRFGQHRQGDVQLLKNLGQPIGATVKVFPNFRINHQRVSSTNIREVLAKGHLHEAKSLLGRDYSLCGRVISGQGRGREWGIPTANINLNRLGLPLHGVFCVKVERHNGQGLYGVANIGYRPTVDGRCPILEIHLFNFDGNLYGDMLKVTFIHHLRQEIKFSSVETLVNQIQSDVREAKHYFKDFIVE